MALNPFTVRSQTIWNNKRDTFATVYNYKEKDQPLRVNLHHLCVPKKEKRKNVG